LQDKAKSIAWPEKEFEKAIVLAMFLSARSGTKRVDVYENPDWNCQDLAYY
jgi:hypothetical protein